MHDNQELTCGRCGKVCVKATSLRRHGYYCRSKPPGQPKSRKRSCEACTRAKIRCDATLPACSSCTSRGSRCRYAEAAQPKPAHTDTNESASRVQPPTDLPVEKPSGDDGSGSAIVPFPHGHLGEWGHQFQLDLLGDMALEGNGYDVILPSWNPPAIDQLTTLISEPVSSPQAEALTRPMSPTSLQWRPARILNLRAYTTPQAEMATTFMARIIASFPQMMLRKETFPPFIHAASYDCTLGTQALPETLINCMGLAQMFATRTKESHNMFWRAVRMEQEKLISQYESYSDHELQAAIQAVLIYTMMRLADGRPEHDDLEIPLLHTLNTISNQLSLRIGGDEFKGALRYDESYWQQWLFQETRRRVVTVARIMNIGFYLDRAISCKSMDGFSLIPLPSKKTLWEAKNEEQWRLEYDQLLQDRVIHGLTTEGKLVGLRQINGRVQVQDVDWQNWYAGQDGFGILVMLASQLLGG